MKEDQFSSEEEYLKWLEDSTVLPRGFSVGVTSFTFSPQEKKSDQPYFMNMGLVLCDSPTPSFAAVFTKNAFCGFPVVIGRELLTQESCTGVVVNNRIANVACPDGKESALAVTDGVMQLLSKEQRNGVLFPLSTGIIGWRLPVKAMKENLSSLVDQLQKKSIIPFSQAIMTTDRYPKAFTVKVGKGTITGVAKGAGMIEPNLATMLVFIFTDIDIPRKDLRAILDKSVQGSFNCISVDGDQSTSDTVMIISSGEVSGVSLEDFAAGLEEVTLFLAEDVVRNGEGCGHVIKVSIKNAPDKEIALLLGKAVVNSPLTKTAIFGNDPNVGRILQAVGDFIGTNGVDINRRDMAIWLGGEEIFSNERLSLDEEKELRLNAYLKRCEQESSGTSYPLHRRTVHIEIDLVSGDSSADVLGSDLSYDYIKENADYRT